ncbi:MAG TPA: phage head-tail connector protein [Pseudonocardia sp.]
MPYDLSDSIPIAVDVKDAAGALTNAGTVVLTITLPDGTTAPGVTVTNPPAATGQYRYTYVPTQVGRHAWRFVATTPNTAYQDVFEVRETVSPSLLSLADAKAHLNITTTTHDDELREYLEACTKVVESYVGPIVRRTHTRRVSGYRCAIPLPHTQVTAVTNITVISDGTSPITLSDLSINTAAGIVSLKSGGSFPYGDMDWTYTVGRSYVESNWTLAAKLILQTRWQQKLGNLPSTQGDFPGYVVSGAGYLVPYAAVALMQPDQVSAGFA